MIQGRIKVLMGPKHFFIITEKKMLRLYSLFPQFDLIFIIDLHRPLFLEGPKHFI